MSVDSPDGAKCCGAWRIPETAPKDCVFLANVGYPFPLVCAWNGSSGKWCCAMINVGPVDGKWDDTYFENEFLAPDDLRGWMPLPEIVEVARPDLEGEHPPAPHNDEAHQRRNER